MRKLSILFAVLFLGFVATHVFAQKKAKPREVIVIEISALNNAVDKREVLINRTSKHRYESAGGIAYGSGAGCGDCSAEELVEINKLSIAELKKSYYAFTAKVWRMGKDISNVSFHISIGGDNCQTQKVFTVYRNQQTKIQLKCGVSLVAYYGFESEEEN